MVRKWVTGPWKKNLRGTSWTTKVLRQSIGHRNGQEWKFLTKKTSGGWRYGCGPEFGLLMPHISHTSSQIQAIYSSRKHTLPYPCWHFFFWGMIDWMFLSIEEFVHIAKLACQKWCNWSFYNFTYWVCNIFFLNSLFLGLWLKTSENLLPESTRSRDPGCSPPYLNQQNTFSSGFHGKELSIQRHPGNVKGTEKELRSELGGQMATVFWISCQHSSKGGQWTTYIRISWDDDG